jgi:gliding motility-associated-like protein
MRVVIFLLISFLSVNQALAQETYNNCNSAFELCPNESYSFSNIGANVTFCGGCEDDFNFCFPTDNTIWLTFTTNATGGDVSIDFSNLVFQNGAGQDNELQAALIQAVAPCDASTYSLAGDCTASETGNFTLNGTALNPNATYYIVVDGDNSGVGIADPAEFTFDLQISGPGIDRASSSVSIVADNSNICLNDLVTFTASLTDCPNNGDYTWLINGAAAATTTDPLWTTSELQDGDVVSVSTSCYTQCIDTVTANAAAMSVYSFPIDAGTDLSIQEGEFAQLSGATSAPVYYWTPSYALSSTSVLNPIATPEETTTYTLTAEENGCILSDYITVYVSSDLTIPNTFSPNGDDRNDTWVIPGIEAYPDNFVKIFTRWGQEVYTTTGYSATKAWDGTTLSSGKAAEGVYYYIIELNDSEERVLKGTINLIR